MFFVIILSSIINGQIPLSVAPLKMGNSWTYVQTSLGDDPKYVKYTVIDSNITINNKLFYKIKIRVNQNVPYYQYARNDGSFYSLYYEEMADSLFLFFKNEMQYDEKWVQYFSPTDSIKITSTVTDTATAIYFGKKIKQYRIVRLDTLGFLSSGERWSYEFGRLYGGVELSEQNLLGCVINDKIYGDTVVVSVENNEPKPINYVLYQNYPNPFNPSTTIKFTIPIAGTVVIKLYDLLGKQIATLVDEKMDAGTHLVLLNIEKINNQATASGVYLYRIISNSFVETKKLMLLK